MSKKYLDGRPLVEQIQEKIPVFEWKGNRWKIHSAGFSADWRPKGCGRGLLSVDFVREDAEGGLEDD